MITEYELKAEDIHQMTLSPLRHHHQGRCQGIRLHPIGRSDGYAREFRGGNSGAWINNMVPAQVI